MTENPFNNIFNSITKAKITVHNKLLQTVFLISFVATIFVIAIFSLMYYLKVPMNYNGSAIPFDDPSYQTNAIIVFALIGAGALFSLLAIIILPLIYQYDIYISYDMNQEPYYYFVSHKRLVYFNQNQLITYYRKSGIIKNETSKEEMNKFIEKNLFWKEEINPTSLKTKDIKNGIKYTYRIVIPRGYEQKTFYVHKNSYNRIVKITEIASKYVALNSNWSKYKVYQMDELASNPQIHPEIQKNITE